MRIVTAREQVEMLLPWRRRKAASEFPWTRDPNEVGHYKADTEAYHAPLENGHRLRVWDDTDYDNPAERPGGQWKGGFDHGPDFDSSDPSNWPGPNKPARMHPDFTAVYDENSPLRAKAYPSRDHAMKAVEQRYRQTFPIGTNTGPHDSGVDYSDLNSFKDHL